MTGEKVILFCAAKSGTPPFTFAWLKNSQRISEDPSVEVHQLKDFSNLVIPSLSISSRGNYTCQVSNSYGSDSYTEFMNVVGMSLYFILFHYYDGIVLWCTSYLNTQSKKFY